MRTRSERTTTVAWRLCAALFALVAAGCGGGSGGEPGPGAAVLNFPPVDSSTLADSIIVTGDDQGGSMTVNGIAAQVQGTTWSVQVPLAAGANELVVRRNGGEVARSQLENALPLLNITGAVVDPATGLLYVSDAGASSVVQIDPATGARSVVSSSLANPQDLVMHPSQAKLFVNDTFRIMAIDLGTGATTTVCSASVGSGPFLNDIYDMTYYVGNPAIATDDRLIVANGSTGTLCSVDIENGNRVEFSAPGSTEVPNGVAMVTATLFTLVVDLDLNVGFPGLTSIKITDGSPGPYFSHAQQGTGPDFVEPYDVVYDANTDTAYVSDRGVGVIAVNLLTSNRSIVVPLDEMAPEFTRPSAIAFDPTSAGLWVTENEFGRLHRLTTQGSRSLFAATSRGTGPRCLSVFDVVLADTSLFVSDQLVDAVFRVDTLTGGRVLVSGAGRGNGTPIMNPRALSLSPVAGQLLVTTSSQLWRVDIATGNADFVTTVLGSIVAVAADPFGNNALIATSENGIILVNLGSTQQATFSPPAAGEVNRDFAVDPISRTGFVALLDGRIQEVNLMTGQRFTLPGPGVPGPSALAIDPSRGRLFVATAPEIYAVDRTSGTTVLFSGGAVGDGMDFEGTAAMAFDPRTGGLLTDYGSGILAVSAFGDRALLSR